MTRKDQMNLPNAPVPSSGVLLTHFLTVSGQVKSREFYAGILGGKVLTPESPRIIRLANSWIILSNGGGSKPDKPDITLGPHQNLTRANSFLNLRVADVQARYAEWKAKGAEFITEPPDNHGWETRCYMRDQDGYILEVGQPSQKMVELFRSDAT